jgi:hypothetical protein
MFKHRRAMRAGARDSRKIQVSSRKGPRPVC